jgi:hypothetical protein
LVSEIFSGLWLIGEAASTHTALVFAGEAEQLAFHHRIKLTLFLLYLNENDEGKSCIPPEVGTAVDTVVR